MHFTLLITSQQWIWNGENIYKYKQKKIQYLPFKTSTKFKEKVWKYL